MATATALAPNLQLDLSKKWTDVTVTDLTWFGFRAIGALLIMCLFIAAPVGVVVGVTFLMINR